MAHLSIDDIVEAPPAQNSRVRDNEKALDELAASIRKHGLLQPILVRPRARSGPQTNSTYVVIAGNRRLRAARRAGLRQLPCLIHVADADRAFLLNLIENVQRRELSGSERVRAISLLASLSDQQGRPLGVRAISRSTGLAPSTISRWLRIDRHPVLRAALEQERLDVGRAMQLVGAPEAHLGDLIQRAPTLLQPQLAHEIDLLTRDPQVLAARRAAANAHWAAAAEHALLLIDDAPGPVQTILDRIRQRADELLAPSRCPPVADPGAELNERRLIAAQLRSVG